MAMKRRALLSGGIMSFLALSLPANTNHRMMSEQTIESILLARYPGIRRNLRTGIYEQLQENDLRAMPHGMNSIAWNIWHMARAEDVGLNRLVTEGEQVFDREGYMAKMKIDIRHFGTGMNAEEVRQLSMQIDLDALRDYHEKVGEQSLKVFANLEQIRLDEKLDQDYLHQVMIEEGVLHRDALWVEAFYQTKARSWFLAHMGLTHSFEHLGQIMLIRKLLGHKGVR